MDLHDYIVALDRAGATVLLPLGLWLIVSAARAMWRNEDDVHVRRMIMAVGVLCIGWGLFFSLSLVRREAFHAGIDSSWMLEEWYWAAIRLITILAGLKFFRAVTFGWCGERAWLALAAVGIVSLLWEEPARQVALAAYPWLDAIR